MHVAKLRGTWGDDGAGAGAPKPHAARAVPPPRASSVSDTARRRSSSGMSTSASQGRAPLAGLKQRLYKMRSLEERATKLGEKPPKVKHVRQLVIGTWEHGQEAAHGTFWELAKRPVMTSPVVALKVLLIVHRLQQQGSPDVLLAAAQSVTLLSGIKMTWQGAAPSSSSDSPWVALVPMYADFVAEKTGFHGRNPAFENNYSVDANTVGNGHVRQLLKVLRSCLSALSVCFAVLPSRTHGGGRDLLCAVMVSLLREADLVHNALTFLLYSLSSDVRLDAERNGFRTLHAELVAVYAQARAQPTLVAAKVVPPDLPSEPRIGGSPGRESSHPAPPPPMSHSRAGIDLAPARGGIGADAEEEDDEDDLEEEDEAEEDEADCSSGHAAALLPGFTLAPTIPVAAVPGAPPAQTHAPDLLFFDTEQVAPAAPAARPPDCTSPTASPSASPPRPLRTPAQPHGVARPGAPRGPTYAPPSYTTASNLTPGALADAFAQDCTLLSTSNKNATAANGNGRPANLHKQFADLLPTDHTPSPSTRPPPQQPMVPGGASVRRRSGTVPLASSPSQTAFVAPPQPPAPSQQPPMPQPPQKHDSALDFLFGSAAPGPAPAPAPQASVVAGGFGVQPSISPGDWDVAFGAPAATPTPVLPSPPEWEEIARDELEFGRRIGHGAFGDVLKASWQGTDVAVKQLRVGSVSEVAIEDFQREISLLCRLRHPHVVLFLGAVTAPPELCIVMEFASKGCLYAALHNSRIFVEFKDALRWSEETARGMLYLHTRQPPIIHRDLKSGNLLLDAHWRVKISDFGLARIRSHSMAQTQVGTYAWMAPEVLENKPYDLSADVYSYAIVMWECVTREEPFKGLHPMQIMRAIDRGDRPALPAGVACAPAFWNLLERCWEHDAASRPPFAQVLKELKQINPHDAVRAKPPAPSA